MKKKFKFSIKDFLNKKENLAIMAVAFVFCAGLIVTNMKSGDIPLHDGDVLVDSQNRRRGKPETKGTLHRKRMHRRKSRAAEILRKKEPIWNWNGTN